LDNVPLRGSRSEDAMLLVSLVTAGLPGWFGKLDAATSGSRLTEGFIAAEACAAVALLSALDNDQRDAVFTEALAGEVPCVCAVAAGERLLSGSAGFRHASRFSQLLSSSLAGFGDSVVLASGGKAVAGEATRELIPPVAIVPLLR
jgi:hypothetical protein